MRDDYSTLDIVKALDNIPRERLRSWMKEDYIKPSKPAEGQGTKAVFTRTNVYAVAFFAKLLDFGFKREYAATLVGFYANAISNDTLEYIIFRPYYSPSGEIEWDQTPVTSQDTNTFLLKTATLSDEDDPHFIQRKNPHWGEPEDWENLLIVNVKRLKQRVDEQLSMLE